MDARRELSRVAATLRRRAEAQLALGIPQSRHVGPSPFAQAPSPTLGEAPSETAGQGFLDMPAEANPFAGLTYEEVSQRASGCTRCDLCHTRTNVAFASGDPNADLMFVGEAPGHDEDLQGIPFVGRAGQLLTKIIEAMGLTRDDVYVCNVLKCRPPENRNPLADEIAQCKPYLARQIELVAPRIIVGLGTFGAQFLLDSQERISRLRGRFHDRDGILIMPTYHPAYLLRNPASKRDVWADMQLVMAELKEPGSATA
jgi:uracil-DNA glycosylase family 4